MRDDSRDACWVNRNECSTLSFPYIYLKYFYWSRIYTKKKRKKKYTIYTHAEENKYIATKKSSSVMFILQNHIFLKYRARKPATSEQNSAHSRKSRIPLTTVTTTLLPSSTRKTI